MRFKFSLVLHYSLPDCIAWYCFVLYCTVLDMLLWIYSLFADSWDTIILSCPLPSCFINLSSSLLLCITSRSSITSIICILIHLKRSDKCLYSHIAMQALIEINPSAMEAARFIHLISSSSSLTLQVHYIPSDKHHNMSSLCSFLILFAQMNIMSACLTDLPMIGCMMHCFIYDYHDINCIINYYI